VHYQTLSLRANILAAQRRDVLYDADRVFEILNESGDYDLCNYVLEYLHGFILETCANILGGQPHDILKLDRFWEFSEVPRYYKRELLALLDRLVACEKTVGSTILEVLQYVNRNYMHPISLRDISEQLHLNPSYLSRHFKKKMHMGLTSYINKLKTEQASLLLRFTNSKVNNIAERVGFMDVKYFLRVFKKVVGVSPSGYRAMQKAR